MKNDIEVFEITTGLDQSIPVKSKGVFKHIDEIIQSAYANEDMGEVWGGIKNLSEIAKLSGIGLCKFFYDALQIWERLDLGTVDEFTDEAYTQTGKHKDTISRYISIWVLFEDSVIPKEYSDRLISHGVKMLMPLGNMHKQGHEVPKEMWASIAGAIDEQEVRKIVKEITGASNRSNHTVRELDRNGNINVWRGGKKYFIGYLARNDKDPIVQQEVARAVAALGLMEK